MKPFTVSTQSRLDSRMRRLCLLFLAALALLALPGRPAACPFCSAVKPSLAQQRAEALATVLAEFAGSGDGRGSFKLQAVLSGQDELEDETSLEITSEEVLRDAEGARLSDLAEGDLVLAFAIEAASDSPFDKLWKLIRVDETSYAYVTQAPAASDGAQVRLPYYAKYLEHPDPLIARDAYREFGAAPFADVARCAHALPMADLRQWLLDPAVPEERRGFYGMALGLATSEADRKANVTALEQCVDAEAGDFRAGFDGVLGGYLLATGEAGLSRVEEKFLSNEDAAEGDARHALTALRFYQEYGRDIPTERLSAAARRLLRRPGFAAEVIADLARWRSWESQDEVVACFDVENKESAALDRAVVGYLRANPKPEAKAALAELRRQASRRVAAAEKSLPQPTSSDQ